MDIIVKIERNEKAPKFSLSQYEFIVTINSSSFKNESILGRVHATSTDPSQIIHYKLLSNNNKTKINSLTGELILFNENSTEINNDIEFFVQASSSSSKDQSSKLLTSRSKVKIMFRYLNLVNDISYNFQTNQSQIHRLNSSNSFFITEHIPINEELLKISVISLHYPTDKYILSLDNYLTTFFLTSSSLMNTYLLKTRRHPKPKAIYMLNIGVKHKLSQQWLPNLRIELIVMDQWTTRTSSSSIIPTDTTSMTRLTTTLMKITNTSVYVESSEFCVENKNYIIHENKNENNDDKIGFVRVIETNSIMNNNISLLSNLFILINQSEIIVDGCRMQIDRLYNPLNRSLQYQLCSFSNDDECYNITLIDKVNSMLNKSENDLRRWLLPMKPIEIGMFILSMIFILVTIILILLICRLKGVHICLTIKNYLFYGKKYGLNNTQQISSPSSKKTVSYFFFILFLSFIYFSNEFIRLLFENLVHHHSNRSE